MPRRLERDGRRLTVADPFPEDDVLGVHVRFELCARLNVENLQLTRRLERDYFARRMHNDRIGADWTSHNVGRIVDVDNDDLRCAADGFA